MEVTVAPPDLDRPIRYTPRWLRREGVARLRVFHGERLAVVTELDDNPGMSVTNAAEEVAQVIEDLLGVRFAPHPTLMVDVSWTFVEHYPRSEARLSAVTFSGRDDEGRLEGPTWRYLQPGELPWLAGALAEGVDWSAMAGRRVVFTYHHGEEVEGVVTSVNDRFVFVRFGQAASSEACEPERLRLA